MKKILPLLLILAWSCSSFFGGTEGKIENVTAEEIYVGLYPRDQYVNIIEYNIVAPRQDEESLELLTNEITQQVKDAQYLQSKYPFEYLITAQEIITNEGDFLKGDYHLLTRHTEVVDLIGDTFGTILGRPVQIELTQDKIQMSFNSEGISILNNNAEGVFSKGPNRLIIWNINTNKLEVVFGFNVLDTTSLLDYISDTIKSPDLTEADILELKYGSAELMGVVKGFQDDADIYRLRHLEYYGSIIEEFKQKLGYYPLQGREELPVYVFIANKVQEEYTDLTLEEAHLRYSLADFYGELSKGLGRPVRQYFDPQYEPIYKPNFYIYSIHGDQYRLTAHVSKAYSFSRKIRDHYFLVEISNKPQEDSLTFTYNQLMKNFDYVMTKNTPPKKEELLLEREKLHWEDVEF